MMGQNWGSAEYQPSGSGSDCGGGSWQERAPSPGMPISFTQKNSIPAPRSPLHFSDYFDDSFVGSRQERTPTPLSQENTISSPLSPSSLALFDSLSPLVELPPVPGPPNFNQLPDTSSSLQTPPLSRHQKYRLRLKAKEQATNRDMEILKQQILMKDKQLARLTWEINNKDEKIDRLISEIKMLKEKIASINHNNLSIIH
ncbi:hypothetical protein V6N13_023919 [Hibiscus sabdariffa]|uniref:Uncharacterized protein n=2 Tax=Hibiscus sabdariffa TaxID=183260 RepID=A0ABR2PN81_9ROSI